MIENNDDIKIARLEEKDIKTIQDLEKKLGDDICLVAVAKKNVLYAIEAKMAPNEWRPIDQVYPEIESLKTYYGDYEKAKTNKAALKTFLIHNQTKLSLKKRPIRIRQIVNTDH
jgi:hypothetical protein